MGVNSKYILSCLTDLARLHICGIVVGAGAAGAAAHLQRREMRASNLQHRNLTILNPAAHSWSNACSRELKVLWIIFNIPHRRPVSTYLCLRKYLAVYLSPSRPRSGSLLSLRVSLKTSLQRALLPHTRILPSFLKPVVDMSPRPMANVPL